MQENLIQKDSKESSSHSWLKNIAILLVIVAVGVAGWWFWPDIISGLTSFMDTVSGWGLWSIPVLQLCCLLSTASCAPIVYFFELAAGALYYHMFQSLGLGLAYACLAVMPGIYLGSLLAFLVGRKLLKPVVEGIIKENTTLVIVNEIVTEEGWPFAFLLGLNPAIPFELLNYALSMSGLPFSQFALSSLGVMPVVAFETYAGVSVAAVAASLAGGSEQSMWEPIIQFGIAGLLIVGMGFYAKKKFNQKAEARNHDREMVLSPKFLVAVVRFKGKLSKPAVPAPPTSTRQEKKRETVCPHAMWGHQTKLAWQLAHAATGRRLSV